MWVIFVLTSVLELREESGREEDLSRDSFARNEEKFFFRSILTNEGSVKRGGGYCISKEDVRADGWC